jgi:hypothetical protein
VEPPASKEGFQMQEQFGRKDPGIKILSFGPQILSLGPPKMGKSRRSKNFEFWPQMLSLGPPKWAKVPGLKILSLGQKTPE